MDFAKLLELHGKLDAETAKLLWAYVTAALRAPNTNEFVKRTLKQALSDQPSGSR
jgi:hypothetical protein